MILFIDDEPHLLKEYDTSLKTSGFHVIWIDNADKGIQFFLKNRHRIRAVILDIMMPPPAILGNHVTDYGLRTGLHILARIREKTSTIPVMLLTNLSTSRLPPLPYKLVELREKRETPPFVLPKLLTKLIDRAEEERQMLEKGKKGTSVIFHGEVRAQQLYVGNHGKQSMRGKVCHTKEDALNFIFAELHDLVLTQDLPKEEERGALRQLKNLRRTLDAPNPDKTEVATAVGRFANMAPWAKAKIEELLTGAAGSMLGSGIIAGIKFALGLPGLP